MSNIVVPADGIKRVIIKNIKPCVAGGTYAAKAAEGIPIPFSAHILTDGHDKLYCRLVYRYLADKQWSATPLLADYNDRWYATLLPHRTGKLEFKIQAWVSELLTWRDGLTKKAAAGNNTTIEEQHGYQLLQKMLPLADKTKQRTLKAYLDSCTGGALQPEQLPQELWDYLITLSPKEKITTSDTYTVDIERKKAAFSTWYELFPRSCSIEPGRHGTFKDVAGRLPYIAAAGFDVLYMPPIHPIGKIKRKGKNNSLTAEEGDAGSPWAIGSDEGGHKALHRELGTLKDFKLLIKAAQKHNIDLAMDIAFQCAPDHPYVKEHPEWFKWRADGTVQFAENPPKRYEDILPFDFESEAWASLWQELLSIFTYWIGVGITIFRVDNPHTKSLRLWEWIIANVRTKHPEVIFLAEAFTRPHIMEHLAMAGFTQSYTYFTWRNTAKELKEYVTELTQGEKQYFFRPNFWPNTPDILPEHLVTGGEPMHVIRVLLAATLSSNYGIYGPVYERGINTPMPGKEEYIDNEKYEVKHWQPEPPSRIWQVITRINHIRQRFAALQQTNNIRFLESSNDSVLAYLKYDETDNRHLLVVITLDPHQPQTAWVNIPLQELTAAFGQPLSIYDELNDNRYSWAQDWNYVALEPGGTPAHVFSFVHHT